MFDISFAEMLVVAVVALVVLGPERLPRAARTLGHLFGRAQRYVHDVKNDIQREIELEDLKKLKASVEGTAHSIESAARTEIRQFQEAMAATETKVESSGSDSAPYPEVGATDAPPRDAPTDTSATPAAATSLPQQPKSGFDTAGAEIPVKN